MMSFPSNSTDFRLLLPETIWLDPEQFDQARAISQQQSNKEQQWDFYLQALALFGFEAWLKEKLPDQSIRRDTTQVKGACYLQVDGFKLCLLTVEQVLDEIVNIPRPVLERPDLMAHFYVVLEVLEEQEQAIVRGFLRHDELMGYSPPVDSLALETEVYSLPLSTLDAEINHLVIYARYSIPSAISVPEAAPAEARALRDFQTDFQTEVADLTVVRTRLSQWLQGTLEQGWQAIDTLINPEANLALSVRHLPSSTKGGKLINFEMHLGRQTVALVVTVVPEEAGKRGIGVQLLPVGAASLLPPQLKLNLLSETEEVLQEVQSRGQDNYIQLKPFKGKPGTNFSIEVSLNETKVRETFEL